MNGWRWASPPTAAAAAAKIDAAEVIQAVTSQGLLALAAWILPGQYADR